MKILFNILNPYGLGADRWCYDGYRHAFVAAGHEFFTVTENDDFQELAEKINPDFLFLDFLHFMDYCRKVKEVPPAFLEKLKTQGMKIFCMTAIGLDKEEDTPEKTLFFKKYLPLLDICFSNFTPETTRNFKNLFGKEMHFVPHAADTTRFFPEKPDGKFRCDIAIVGSFYTQKRAQFAKLLLPLLKKYHVCIYGPGWTLKGKILRLLSGFSRRLGISSLTEFANVRRMSISIDDERKLYASAKICANIHEYYRDGTTKGFSNEREFKTTASGGFLVSDYIPGMERYFELGKEIVAVKSADEWFAKIDYYLNHEVERKKIQEAGTARVLREHTYAHRVEQLLNLYHSF